MTRRNEGAPASGQLAKGALLKNCTNKISTFSRKRAAIHEAGHVISHKAHGIRVKSVELYQEGPHWLGWTATERQPDISPISAPETDLAVACGHLAGHISEMLHAAPVPPDHNLDEIGIAHEAAGIMAWKGQNIDLTGYTGDLLKRNEAALIRLAGNLMLSRKLSGSRLRHLLKGVQR